eukprot:9754254-Prorocentrum_lima.AAC.1
MLAACSNKAGCMQQSFWLYVAAHVQLVQRQTRQRHAQLVAGCWWSRTGSTFIAGAARGTL